MNALAQPAEWMKDAEAHCEIAETDEAHAAGRAIDSRHLLE